jgi:hypothetical protein
MKVATVAERFVRESLLDLPLIVRTGSERDVNRFVRVSLNVDQRKNNLTYFWAPDFTSPSHIERGPTLSRLFRSNGRRTGMAEGKVRIGSWSAPIAGFEPPLDILETEIALGSRFSLTVWKVAQPPFKIDQKVTMTIEANDKRISIRAKHSARSKSADRMFLAFERC